MRYQRCALLVDSTEQFNALSDSVKEKPWWFGFEWKQQQHYVELVFGLSVLDSSRNMAGPTDEIHNR